MEKVLFPDRGAKVENGRVRYVTLFWVVGTCVVPCKGSLPRNAFVAILVGGDSLVTCCGHGCRCTNPWLLGPPSHAT